MAKICLWQLINHIPLCFRGSPRKFFVLSGVFFWVILTSQLSFVSLAYPFVSLFLFKSRHVGIVLFYFKLLDSRVFFMISQG